MEEKKENVSQTDEAKETQPEAKEKVEKAKKTSPVIEAAREANRIKAELLDREEKLLDRKEKLAAEEMLGGKTEAGQGTPKKPEDDAIEYSKKVESGEVNPLETDDSSN